MAIKTKTTTTTTTTTKSAAGAVAVPISPACVPVHSMYEAPTPYKGLVGALAGVTTLVPGSRAVSGKTTLRNNVIVGILSAGSVQAAVGCSVLNPNVKGGTYKITAVDVAWALRNGFIALG